VNAELQRFEYADPPTVNPQMTAQQRRDLGRLRRRDAPFEGALSVPGSMEDVWDVLRSRRLGDSPAIMVLAGGPRAIVVPTALHGRRLWDFSTVDDMLPMSFETDLLAHALRMAGSIKRNQQGRVVRALVSSYSQALHASLAQRRTDWVRFGITYSASLKRSALAKMSSASFTSYTAGVKNFVNFSGQSLRVGRLAQWWGVGKEEVQDILGPGLESEFAQYRETLSDSDAGVLVDYRIISGYQSPQGDVLVLLGGMRSSDMILLHAQAVVASPFEGTWGLWRQGSDVQRVLVARATVPIMAWDLTGWSTAPDGSVGRVWSRLRWHPPRKEPNTRKDSAIAERHAVVQGACLGLSHARTGDAWAIAGYLGKSDRFAKALVRAVSSSAG
jgi:hypothetical protein